MGIEWGAGMREGRENRDWDVRKREKKHTENIAICLREITEGQEIMQHKDNIQQGSSLRIL